MADPLTHSHDTATPALSVESEYVLVPREFLHFLRGAPVSSGVCCCGDEMDRHSDPMSCGHSPVDMWDHELDQWLKQIAAAPAPNPSPAAKGGDAVLEWETCKPLTGNYAEEAYTSFGYFRVERFAKSDHLQLTGPGLDMRWDQGVDSGKAAVEEYFVSILRGYAPLLAALATPSPQPADAVREALETARDYISDAATGTLTYKGSGEGFKAMAAEDLASLEAALAALASDPAPAGEAVEPVAWRYQKGDNTFINEHYQPWKAAYGWTFTPLYAHPAPEDTARLREDLERVTRELAFERQVMADLQRGYDELDVLQRRTERERDDARKALETATEDTSDAIREAFIAGAMAVHEEIKRDHPDAVPRGDPEFSEAAHDYAAARSASREGASDE